MAPSPVADALKPGVTACAILLGTGVCLTNMYFGLQAGMVNLMPMQSALLAFSLFRSIQPSLSKPLSTMETTLIVVIAGALGLTPFTSGFTSFIPALRFLATPDKNGPTRFGLGQLLIWSIGTYGLGLIASALFRNLLILRAPLRFPSATVTGTLIGVLFKEEDIVVCTKPTQNSAPQSQSLETDLD
ncbi:OPT superfamily [Neonectria magnoliae]|uniref:OPT superfamily n=1 Tax=Neonectria magnoliae TaxID=2732573 RepID=A0ABR1I876_9HYPO